MYDLPYVIDILTELLHMSTVENSDFAIVFKNMLRCLYTEGNEMKDTDDLSWYEPYRQIFLDNYTECESDNVKFFYENYMSVYNK